MENFYYECRKQKAFFRDIVKEKDLFFLQKSACTWSNHKKESWRKYASMTESFF